MWVRVSKRREISRKKVPELPNDPSESLLNTDYSMYRVKFHKTGQEQLFRIKQLLKTYKLNNSKSSYRSVSSYTPGLRNLIEYMAKIGLVPEAGWRVVCSRGC